MSDLQVLDDCCQVLDDYRRCFERGIKANNHQDDPPAIMLVRGLAFWRQSLKATRLLLSEGGYEAQACAVCRAFFEVAIRLLWASRENWGWARLQTYWAKEDKKLAEDLKDVPDLAQAAGELLRFSKEVLDRRDEGGDPIKTAPKMPETIADIEKRDKVESRTSLVSSKYSYAWLYRGLCRGAHGHISVLDPPSRYAKGFRRLGCRAAVLAASALLLALVHVVGEEDQRERGFESLMATIQGCWATFDRSSGEDAGYVK